MKNKIPNNFLWGASTSAYQSEGGWNKDNKGISVQDLTETKPNVTNFQNATNHYENWKEDVILMKEMGFKSYRFSIAWTRIFPDGIGEVNQKGLEFYNNLINELIKYNIEPIVTMYHFDLPLALEKQGGWRNRDLIIPAFTNYAKTLFENFGDRVKYWLTINEQNIMIIVGHVIGLTKPNQKNPFKDLFQQNHHMLIAQAEVIKMYHSMKLNGKIGPAPNISAMYPETNKPEDIDAAYKANAWRNWLYLDAACFGEYNKIVWDFFEKNDYIPELRPGDLDILKAGKPDFIAFNYYSTGSVKASTEKGPINLEKSNQQVLYNIPEMFDHTKNIHVPTTEFGWEIDTTGFLMTCRMLHDRYHLPLILTENGLGAYDKLENGKIHDQYRINYLKGHISLIPQIISEGIQLFGYNPWSAIDLVSTHEGVKKRYGFIYVDINDNGVGNFKRYKKDSFYWYQKVISSNGAILE